MMAFDWNTFLSTLAVTGIGGIFKYVISINAHLAKLNGSVQSLKDWRQQHEELHRDYWRKL